MFRTKGGVERPLRLAARIATPGPILAAVGCADTSGLRSIWPDRPSLLGFRDRPHQPAPDPADDYYTRYMRAARQRSDALAKRAGDHGADPPRGEDGSRPPGPDDPLNAQETGAPPASRLAQRSRGFSDRPTRDETIRVTLGTPEPLPVMARPEEATLASASAPTTRDTDRGTSRIPTGPSPDLAPDRPAVERPGSVVADSSPAPRRPSTRPSRSAPSSEDARAILARSEAKLRSLETYQVKMSRVERVDGRLQPEEEVILSIRRRPKEVRLQWASGPSQGREVIYSTRVDPRSLFVHMARTAIPLPTMKMAIDSPMVTRSSRHSITEAGFDTIIENLRQAVDQADAAGAARGRAAYRGIEKPPGLDRPAHVFTRRSPNGETWTVFLDARTLLPSMVVAKDASGQLVEKYIYHEVSENPPELASSDAFDPDRRWGRAKGLTSRFARGAPSSARSQNGESAIR